MNKVLNNEVLISERQLSFRVLITKITAIFVSIIYTKLNDLA
jgi:hypothetical protein